MISKSSCIDLLGWRSAEILSSHQLQTCRQRLHATLDGGQRVNEEDGIPDNNYKFVPEVEDIFKRNVVLVNVYIYTFQVGIYIGGW